MDINKISEENYSKEKIIINLVWANIFGLIILIITGVFFCLPYFILWKDHGINSFTIISFIENNIIQLIIMSILFIIGIILHEVIQGIFFAKYSENKFKSIKYGILPKEKLYTPYCHCIEVLKINHYRIAAIMPTIILGLIPAIISLIIGNFALLFFGIIFITCGGGDILMLLKIIKEKKDILIYDLPDEAGFIIYRKK
jgi:hypothetical protein